MRFRNIVVLFLLFRFIDFLIVHFSQYFIPYLGFFPYKEVATLYNLPKFITAFATFDGAHYLLIAKNGYSQYRQAFFPLYPLLIRWLSPLFLNNHLLTALVISNIAFLLGLWLFSKYLLEIGNWKLEIWPLIFLLTFPTSFFFGAAYTEGLFFFLLAGCLYFLKKERFYLAGIFAFFASLTKLIGLFLIIFFILKLIRNCLPVGKAGKLEIRNFKLTLITLSPILGLTLYSLYLWQTTGDPFFFLNSQWAFGAHRTSSLVFLPQVYFRYLKIFFTANWNFQYFISLFEFFTFNFVFFVVILNLFQDLRTSFWGPRRYVGGLQNRFWTSQNDRIGLGLFSLINLMLPTLTGTLSSIPRYALFSLSLFIYLSQIKNLLKKVAIATIFVILHIIMLGFFSQGYFVS